MIPLYIIIIAATIALGLFLNRVLERWFGPFCILILISFNAQAWFNRLLMASRPVSASTVDGSIFIDFETGTSGDPMTPLIMTNSTHGSLGSWQVSSNGSNNIIITNWSTSVRTPIVVDGTTYTNDGTRGFISQLTNLNSRVEYNFTQSYSNISMGCWIKIEPNGANTVIDYIQFSDNPSGGGKWSTIQVTAGGTGMHAHGQTNVTSTFGPNVTFSTSTRYWVTMGFRKGSPGTNTMNLYTTNGVLVGSSECVTDATNIVSFCFGRTDGHGGGQPPTNRYVFFDNIVINTNGVFPLGP